MTSPQPTVSMAQIAEVWEQLKLKTGYAGVNYPLGRAHECLDRPGVVMVGADEKHGYELYALIHVTERRIVEEDEFPSEHFDRHHWIDILLPF